MAKHHNEADRWYGLLRWKKRRRMQLKMHPLCRMCLEQQHLVTPADCVDHVIPHGGDRYLFEYGELQSLCSPCHDSIKRTVEYRGYDPSIGVDGWPIDPLHPAYTKRF
jgi:5-methylcytosine-specific restriction endonuclease McrA